MIFIVSAGCFKFLTSLVSVAMSSLKYLMRSYNDSVSFCCSAVRFKIVTSIIKATSGMRMSRMINPVIGVGLVKNSCGNQPKKSEGSFIFRYLNIPDNDQNVLHQEKFPHPL